MKVIFDGTDGVRFTKRFARKLDEIVERAERICVEADKVATKMVKASAETKLRDAFNKAVKDWYDSYTPHEYERRGSLYNIFEINPEDEDGSNLDLFEDSAVMGRSGDKGTPNLYEHVFEQGWHGGAYGDGYGTPRYRYPTPWYTHWGKDAIRTESALNRYLKAREEEIMPALNVEYQTILREEFDKRMNEILRG